MQKQNSFQIKNEIFSKCSYREGLLWKSEPKKQKATKGMI